MSDDRFDTCWPFVLAQECPRSDDWSNARNFSHDAHDPGGATMCGIIQREYDHYCKIENVPVQGVRGITKPQGEWIYRNWYWLPYCPLMPAGLDLQFFDSSVNEGTHQAIRILQVAIGARNDGMWGQDTLAHVQSIADIPGAVQRFTDRRKEVYREMSGFRYFGSDWIRRSTEIGQQSLAMTRPVVPPSVVLPQIAAAAAAPENGILRRLEIAETKIAKLIEFTGVQI